MRYTVMSYFLAHATAADRLASAGPGLQAGPRLTVSPPRSASQPGTAAATGYSASSGGFRDALSRLRSPQLASGRGEVLINDTLTEMRQ